MGLGSTPGHKTRPTAGRWAACTEPHQYTSASRDLQASSAVRGRQWNECCQSTAAATEASPGAFGGLFGCSRRLQNKPGRKNIFRKKNGHMGVHSCGSSNTAKNLFSAQLDFPRSRTAKKAPKTTQACFHCCSSALATVFQLPQLWAN